jgi:hypothetical protein
MSIGFVSNRKVYILTGRQIRRHTHWRAEETKQLVLKAVFSLHDSVIVSQIM